MSTDICVLSIYSGYPKQCPVLSCPLWSQKHSQVFDSLLPFHIILSNLLDHKMATSLPFSLLYLEFRSSSQHHPNVLSLPHTSDLPCGSFKPLQCDGSDVKPFSHTSTGLLDSCAYYMKNPANLKEDEIQWEYRWVLLAQDPRFTSS